MKILALMKYGDRAASTRQRLLQFKPHFNQSNIEIECSSLFDNDYLSNVFQKRRANKLRVLACYLKRLKAVLWRSDYDALWIHCEAFPYCFGFMERLVFIRGKPVIYDFDDAIFHQYDAHQNPLVRFMLGKKLHGLLRGAALAVCGNAYLQNYARQFCKNTIIIPTVVDTTRFISVPSHADHKRVTVGWIGSPSTWNHMNAIVPLLTQLADELKLTIRVIGAGPQTTAISNFEFVDWTEQTEVAEIQGMDIGIMPLPDDLWARGKCGYKLIQYMACGVAVVASPVGVNSEIVENGVNGFTASDDQEWRAAIRKLALNVALRRSMGVNGRTKVKNLYSLQTQGPKLVEAVSKVLQI